MTTIRRNVIMSAVLAALTAVLAQISIPIGPVPISLATLGGFLAGGLLGGKYGAYSQGIYVLLGAIGIPVFSAFRSGYGMLIGPTGGYIFGYIALAFLTGWLSRKWGGGAAAHICAMVVGCAALYLMGTAWFMFSTGSSLLPALAACVIPFLPGDAAKIAAATVLVRRLTPILQQNGLLHAQ